MATRPQVGRVGLWSGTFRTEDGGVGREAAREAERLGYGAVWFPSRQDIFERARDLLDATRRIVVATGIASIWMHPAAEVAATHHALTQAHPHRFLLGLGVSHAGVVDEAEAGRYRQPVAHMLNFLDTLDAAEPPVPASERILAALGPRMVEIARTRSAGVHPYLVTAEHTQATREALGAGPLLAPEQGVVLETDPARARSIARTHLAFYLRAPNYTNSWLRLGFTEADFAHGGSDRLVDTLVAWGDVDTIRERVAAHLRAGADHVCLQVLTERPQEPPIEQWRALASLATAPEL